MNPRQAELNIKLHYAVQKGDSAKAEELLNDGADVNANKEERGGGDTPLAIAAKNGHVNLALLLIRRGATVYSHNNTGIDKTTMAVKDLIATHMNAADLLSLIVLLQESGLSNSLISDLLPNRYHAFANKLIKPELYALIAETTDVAKRRQLAIDATSKDKPLGHIFYLARGKKPCKPTKGFLKKLHRLLEQSGGKPVPIAATEAPSAEPRTELENAVASGDLQAVVNLLKNGEAIHNLSAKLRADLKKLFAAKLDADTAFGLCAIITQRKYWNSHFDELLPDKYSGFANHRLKEDIYQKIASTKDILQRIEMTNIATSNTFIKHILFMQRGTDPCNAGSGIAGKISRLHRIDEKLIDSFVTAINKNNAKAAIKFLQNLDDQSLGRPSIPGNLKHAVLVAATKGQTEVIRQALQKGLPVESGDGYNTSLLMLAATYEKIDAVKLLLTHHANPLRTNVNGEHAIDRAVRQANTQLVEILINAAPKDHLSEHLGLSLFLAAQNNLMNIAGILIGAGADLSYEYSTTKESLVAFGEKRPAIQERLAAFIAAQPKPDAIKISIPKIAELMGNTEILEFIQHFVNQQQDEKHEAAVSEPIKSGLYPVATNIATIEASLPGVISRQQQAATVPPVEPEPAPRVQAVDDYLFSVSAEEQKNLCQAPVLATTNTREPLVDISPVTPGTEKPASVLEQLAALPSAPTHLPALSMFARNQESEDRTQFPASNAEKKKLSS